MPSTPHRLSLYPALVTLSAPIAGVQFAQIALTTTDLAMMGLLGVEALAGGGLALLLYNQFRTMCVGIVTGLGNLVAAAIARGERRDGSTAADPATPDEVRDLVHAALLLGTVIALMAVGLLIVLAICLSYLGLDPVTVALAKPLMAALAPALLPMVWLNVLRQFAVGMRRPGSLLWVTILAVAINALLNGMFIFGWLGMPPMGLTGIGLATTSVQIWMFVVFFRALGRDQELKSHLSLRFWTARRETVFMLAKMGWPVCVTYGIEASLSSVASVLIGHFGPLALAASNVVNQLAKVAYQINVGLSHGASIMVSRAVGHRRHRDVAAIAKAAMGICFVAMTAVGLVVLCFPHQVLSPFVGSGADTAMPVAKGILWFAVANLFFAASQNISIGLLRGLGDTTSGLTYTVFAYWFVGVPAMILCSHGLGWGAAGVWLGLCVAFGSASILLWRHFARLAVASVGK